MKDRSRELEMLHETLQILELGFYEKNGRKVQLKLSRSEMEEAKVIMPNDVWDTSSRPEFEPPFVMGRCVINCENKDSFAVARERAAEKHQFGNNSQNVLVLNMANPVNPGGGVRRGAKAQEEDLCRNSRK